VSPATCHPAPGGEDKPFVSRAGLKLDAALEAFGLDVMGCVCADFGANVGGFTDCLLRRGARKVYAVDTGYGDLAWTLRNDARVVVMERTNALHVAPPTEGVDLVVCDVAWTPQLRIVPAAMDWLAAGARERIGRVVSLLKPHYEYAKLQGRKARGPLDHEQRREVIRAVGKQLAEAGVLVEALCESPIRGKGGNREALLLLRPA
jgi:23S rRNA (cytidine1920-2'-O)/16S rRNA (cytidine1409-2'-O)-methyltransferase